MNNWFQTLKNAKKTCIQQGNLRKVHYELPGEKEMVEEFNMDTGVITRRAWKIKKGLGGEGQWSIELGDPEPTSLSRDELLIKENSNQPFVSRRVTKRCLEWRIRNLPYPIDTYTVTADVDNRKLTVRTTNKKYFKNLDIPEFERLSLRPEQNCVEFTHKFNTLIITYKKPEELIEFERAIFDDIKLLNVKNEGEMDCKPS